MSNLMTGKKPLSLLADLMVSDYQGGMSYTQIEIKYGYGQSHIRRILRAKGLTGKTAPKDIAGEKFGRWTVLKRDLSQKGKWLCRCECGVEKSVLAGSLKSGMSKSCGCIQRGPQEKKPKLPRVDGDILVVKYLDGVRVQEIARQHCCSVSSIYNELKLRNIKAPRQVCFSKEGAPDLSGGKFGRLVVICKVSNGRWSCKCECGASVRAATNTLLNGMAKSCGCYKRDRTKATAGIPTKDLAGRKFGLLTVLKVECRLDYGVIGWLCECECGVKKTLSTNTLTTGATRTCGSKIHHPLYKGGKTKSAGGYIRITMPDYLYADSSGRVLEHRYVMSQHIGRPLKRTETVHHKNGIRDDNRIENLELRSGQHGAGQAVEDKIADAVEYLKEYAPHLLKN